MHFDWQFFWKSLITPSGPFLDGLMLTIVISVVAMVLATVLAWAVLIQGLHLALPVWPGAAS